MTEETKTRSYSRDGDGQFASGGGSGGSGASSETQGMYEAERSTSAVTQQVKDATEYSPAQVATSLHGVGKGSDAFVSTKIEGDKIIVTSLDASKAPIATTTFTKQPNGKRPLVEYDTPVTSFGVGSEKYRAAQQLRVDRHAGYAAISPNARGGSTTLTLGAGAREMATRQNLRLPGSLQGKSAGTGDIMSDKNLEQLLQNWVFDTKNAFTEQQALELKTSYGDNLEPLLQYIEETCRIGLDAGLDKKTAAAAVLVSLERKARSYARDGDGQFAATGGSSSSAAASRPALRQEAADRLDSYLASNQPRLAARLTGERLGFDHQSRGQADQTTATQGVMQRFKELGFTKDMLPGIQADFEENYFRGVYNAQQSGKKSAKDLQRKASGYASSSKDNTDQTDEYMPVIDKIDMVMGMITKLDNSPMSATDQLLAMASLGEVKGFLTAEMNDDSQD